MNRRPTDRSFGIAFAGVFAAVCLWPARRGGEPRLWAAAVAGVFLLLALAAPDVLGPLNRTWMAFARALSKITQPVFMTVLFYGIVTPFAVLLWLAGKKLLRLNREPGTDTYWIERDAAPGSMRDQF